MSRKALEQRAATEQRERDARVSAAMEVSLRDARVQLEQHGAQAVGLVMVTHSGRAFVLGTGPGTALHAGYGAAQDHVRMEALKRARFDLVGDGESERGKRAQNDSTPPMPGPSPIEQAAQGEQEAPSLDQVTEPHVEGCTCVGCEAEAAADNRPEGWLSTEAEREAAQAFDEGR